MQHRSEEKKEMKRNSLWVRPHQQDQGLQGNQRDPEVGHNKSQRSERLVKLNYEPHRVSQGSLWARRLQVVLVLLQLQQFQVVQPLPSPHAPLEDPANRDTRFYLFI